MDLENPNSQIPTLIQTNPRKVMIGRDQMDTSVGESEIEWWGVWGEK